MKNRSKQSPCPLVLILDGREPIGCVPDWVLTRAALVAIRNPKNKNLYCVAKSRIPASSFRDITSRTLQRHINAVLSS